MFKKPERLASLIVLIGGVIGLVASFVLSVESLVLASNKDAVLNCDLNAVVSCAAVANHWSASLLGVPNSFLGMIAFPVIVTIAVALLAGVRFPKWFMRATQIGVVGGILFAGWMFYMSFSVIGILCPWCLTTDVAMIVLFFSITRYNIITKALPLKKYQQDYLEKIVKKDYDMLAMWSLLVLIVVMIFLKFGSDLFA